MRSCVLQNTHFVFSCCLKEKQQALKPEPGQMGERGDKGPEAEAVPQATCDRWSVFFSSPGSPSQSVEKQRRDARAGGRKTVADNRRPALRQPSQRPVLIRAAESRASQEDRPRARCLHRPSSGSSNEAPAEGPKHHAHMAPPHYQASQPPGAWQCLPSTLSRTGWEAPS